jgi:hypothetical protein
LLIWLEFRLVPLKLSSFTTITALTFRGIN